MDSVATVGVSTPAAPVAAKKSDSGFTKLGLSPDILKAIAESGYTTPTPIQVQSIPELLAGGDVLASADTGTGKTAAFMLPALERLSVASTKPGKGPRVLVLTPTRELAAQITNASKKYGKYVPRIKTVSILGGMPYEPQRRDLRHFVDILVATPGRLLDHTHEGKVDYSRVEMFVLDEADRMLDMGFLEDVQSIADQLPKEHQTVMFSATLKKVAGLAGKLTKNAKKIEIAQSEQTNDNVEQRIIFANDETHKRKLLKEIFAKDVFSQAIVFSATKAHTETLAEDLEDSGIAACAIHGDLRQRSREAIIRKLRTNKFQVLVATDVAARGIDIPGLSHVINYDIPRTAEDYTHRIGRTGRAGSNGIAITFVCNSERHKLRFIEKDLGHQVPVVVIEGLEAKPASDSRGNGRNAGGGRGGRPNSRQRGGFGGGRFGGGEGRANDNRGNDNRAFGNRGGGEGRASAPAQQSNETSRNSAGRSGGNGGGFGGGRSQDRRGGAGGGGNRFGGGSNQGGGNRRGGGAGGGGNRGPRSDARR